jgi:hypothetical protein
MYPTRECVHLITYNTFAQAINHALLAVGPLFAQCDFGDLESEHEPQRHATDAPYRYVSSHA